MAFGMKHWVGLAALGMAGAAALLLPPRSVDDLTSIFGGPRERPLTPAAELADEAAFQVRLADAVLRRIRLQDSLTAILAATPHGESPVTLEYPPDLPEELARGLRAQVAEEAGASVPPGATAVGVFVVPGSYGGYPPAGRGPSSRRDTYTGTLPDGRPYCMVARRLLSMDERYLRSALDPDRGSMLGLCSYWLSYGPPGARLLTWLEESGYRFGVLQELSAELRGMISFSRRGAFGIRPFDQWRRWEGVPIASETCLLKDADSCRALVLSPAEQGPYAWGGYYRVNGGWSEQAGRQSRELTDFLFDDASMPAPTLGPLTWVLFSEIEAREGAEAFRAFWTSPEPVEVAFREAFGDDLGPWVQRWFREYYPVDRVGPAVEPKSAALSILTILAALAVGIILQRSRTVG